LIEYLLKGLFPGKYKNAAVLQSELSAQAFLNVRDIRGRVLYTKDGYVFSYIRVQPISIDLLSNSEKNMLINNLSGELSTLDKPFKFFCISRPVDISGLIDEFMTLYASTADEVQKALLEQEIKLYKHFALSGDTIVRQFYMVIWDRMADDAEYALNRRAKELVNKFRNCGITSEILGEEQIVGLCNLFGNPSCAHIEDTNVTAAMPLLKEAK
jgi:hypothetical protein